MRKILAIVSVIIPLFYSPAAMSQSPDLRTRLLGTWKIIAATREEIPSGVKTDQMGPRPAGYVSYSADGRMMAIVIRSDRRKPAGMPNAAEAEALFRSMVSYAGTYVVEGDKVTHTVDVSWNESWTGTKQIRVIKFDGEILALSTEQSRDPIDGKESIRTITYERVK